MGYPGWFLLFPHGHCSHSHLLSSISLLTAERIWLRSPDVTSSHENRRVSSCTMGMVQTQSICWSPPMSFHPAPSSPSILLHGAEQCWDLGHIAGRSVNHFANGKRCCGGLCGGCALRMLSGGCGMLEALPAPALPV